MKVFKVCFQIIRSKLPILLIYVGIYLTIALVVSQISGGSITPTFTAAKNNLTVYDDAPDSPLAQGLKDYLAKNAVLVSVADEKETQQDALFFQKTDGLLRIPVDFSAAFKQGNAKVELTSRPGDVNTVYTKQLVDRYLNLVNLYAQSLPGLSEAQAAQKAAETAALQTDVRMRTFGQNAASGKAAFTFSYLSISLIAVLVLSVSSVLQTFQKLDLRRRNLSAPLRPFSMNLQLMLGNLVFALGVWAAMSAFVIAFNHTALTFATAALYAGNMLALTFVSLGLGFLASSLVHSYEAANAIANVVSLGMSFLCGVFIPQEYMGKGVLAAAHFLPVYWYVHANDLIEGLTNITSSALVPIFQAVSVQALFAVALLTVPLLISRYRRQSAQ